MHAVTSALALRQPEEAAAPVLQTVGETLRCDLGVLWEVDAAADVLRCAGVWHLPAWSAPVQRFSRQSPSPKALACPAALGHGAARLGPGRAVPHSVAGRQQGPCGALALLRATERPRRSGVLWPRPPPAGRGVVPLLTGLGSQIAQFIERQAEVLLHARERSSAWRGRFSRTAPQGPPSFGL
jgi:hypothetical protein